MRDTITVHKKQDGYLLVSRMGDVRFMTWFESLKYSLFGIVPKQV